MSTPISSPRQLHKQELGKTSGSGHKTERHTRRHDEAEKLPDPRSPDRSAHSSGNGEGTSVPPLPQSHKSSPPSVTGRQHSGHGKKTGVASPPAHKPPPVPERFPVSPTAAEIPSDGPDSSQPNPRLASYPGSPREPMNSERPLALSPRSPQTRPPPLPVMGELPHPSDLKAYAELYVITYFSTWPLDENNRHSLTQTVLDSTARDEIRVKRDQKHAPYVEVKKIEAGKRRDRHRALVATMLDMEERNLSTAQPLEGIPLHAEAGPKEKDFSLTSAVAACFVEEFFNGDALCVRELVRFFQEMHELFGEDIAEMAAPLAATATPLEETTDLDNLSTTAEAGNKVIPFLQEISRKIFGTGSLGSSLLPRKFLSAMRAMDRRMLGLCEFAVDRDGNPPGRKRVHTLRSNLLVQFMITRTISVIFMEVIDHCVSLLHTHPAFNRMLLRFFNKHNNQSSRSLIASILANTDKFHSEVLPKIETEEEKSQRTEDRIGHFRQRSAPAERKAHGMHSQRLQTQGRAMAREFRHQLGEFRTWLKFDTLAPALQEILDTKIDHYRTYRDFAILQSACHTAALIYRKEATALSLVEERQLKSLIGRLHDKVFVPAEAELSSSGQSDQSEISSRLSATSEISELSEHTSQ